MTNPILCLALDFVCLGFALVFFWSTVVVVLGLLRPTRHYSVPTKRLTFAVLVCARNEEAVIRAPVKSVLMSKYPAACRDVIVLADNCTDATAARAREAGAIVWEKQTPSSGKGDVLTWGIERVRALKKYDAIAVFDSDNLVADDWFDAVNAALQGGETVVTGRRHASNARANTIAGWYTIYWDIMNELSNRVRVNLGLSGKLTGTGFAFLASELDETGWSTHTLVEDVEFTVQTNLRGSRVGYVPEADYADEQPERFTQMWRQLRRWTTGGWQVVSGYFLPWARGLRRQPSLRLFDSYFAILTGVSVAFVHLFNIVAFVIKLFRGIGFAGASGMFFGIIAFTFAMGWFMAIASVALSQEKRRPRLLSIFSFPLFSLVMSASVIYTLVFPTRQWKPIHHTGGNRNQKERASAS